MKSLIAVAVVAVVIVGVFAWQTIRKVDDIQTIREQTSVKVECLKLFDEMIAMD